MVRRPSDRSIVRLSHQPLLLPSKRVRFASPRAPHLFCRVARTLSTLAMALMSNGGAPLWFGSIPFLSSPFTSFFVLPFPRRRAPRVWCDRRGCVRDTCASDARVRQWDDPPTKKILPCDKWAMECPGHTNAREIQATHHHHHHRMREGKRAITICM